MIAIVTGIFLVVSSIVVVANTAFIFMIILV